MKKVVLVCVGGVSTGILCKAIRQAANSDGTELDVSAHALDQLNEFIDGADVLLVAPQISFRFDEIKGRYPNIVTKQIDMVDYGMMNGKKIYNELKNEFGW